MKSMRRLAPVLAVAALLQGCATSHLINWSKGEPSAYKRPAEGNSVYVRPGATVLAFPVAVAFDVVTFPFQWVWEVYPFGEENAPDSFEGR
jgi:uncharacterized protein YceK